MKFSHGEIICMIEHIRRKNNRLWMDLMRLAFKHSPDEAKRIMKQITKNDKEISRWTGRF